MARTKRFPRRAQTTLIACALLAIGFFSTAAHGAVLPAPGGFELQGSNGYRVQVVGFPASQGSPSYVLVFVLKGSSYAIYTAPAKATPTSFEADLGVFGRVDVEYHPNGMTFTRRGTCDAPVTSAAGFYEGVIEFRAEGGYTEATATRAEGTVPDLPCGGSGEAVGGRLPGATLSAYSFADSAVYFRVYKNAPRERAVFSASIAEASGDVGIVRSVSVAGSASSFTYGEKPVAALAPPAPFSGSAAFRKRPHARSSWRGDLSVDFPGHPGVKLTGRRSFASLTLHARVTERSLSPHDP